MLERSHRYEDLEQRLRERERPLPPAVPGLQRAAVAVILRRRDGELETLLMTRAHHPGDHWSGQVSLPGGRAEAHDPDLLATAVRETREEVSLDLERDGRFLARLDTVRAIGRGRVLPMTITPFVFAVDREVQPVAGAEAQDLFWLPLARAAAGELDSTYLYRRRPFAFYLACWRYQERVVWGLTYRMLRGLLKSWSP